MDRIARIAGTTFAPEQVRKSLESLLERSAVEDFNACSDSFLGDLGRLLAISPPMLDTLRSHPEHLAWLKEQAARSGGKRDIRLDWDRWNAGGAGSDIFDRLRAFKRREYLLISFLDISGLISFEEVVRRLSDLADWVISSTLAFCRRGLVEEESARTGPVPENGFAVFALGKLGGRELNYSSDVDLVFCRRHAESEREMRFFTRLGERLVQALSRPGPEGFLYRVDMRLRPHGATGPLAPTIDSLMNYYESWGEPWEKQALIKTRFVAGCADMGKRFQEFVASFTFARELDESALEDVKRVKHRAEKQYAVEPRIHLKQGAGGIRDIEFYVQFSQLTIGWKFPEVRTGNTLQAIGALSRSRVLLDGEESALSLAYLFLRTVEHRLQLQALTPQSVLPDSPDAVDLLARGLGFESVSGAGGEFMKVLNRRRVQIRDIVERVYLAPGYLRLNQKQEELARLLSERLPIRRVREMLSAYGFQDIEKAWQNIRLLALGPAGRLLPPGERRSFVEFAFPMLEVLRDSIDPDEALHTLEDFAAATGNRVSFLRVLASRRPHLSRLTNLLALSSLCRQILTRHPEYFDSLARGIYLHEGRREEEMYSELQDRVGLSPRGEKRADVLRKFRQREMVRIAYRDLAGLADSLEISRELSDLAAACIKAAVDWTRPPYTDPSRERRECLQPVALGKLGSRQMHYSSDIDLIFLYDWKRNIEDPEARARFQSDQDERVEKIVELLSGVTPEGVAYPVDLRLRPGGAGGTLAQSWESFTEYAKRHMEPWERMALVRSGMLDGAGEHRKWDSLLGEIVYEFDWNEEALDSVRHIKKRIEAEISRESRTSVDFKYGKGGIADLEFLVQFLQVRHGRRNPGLRTPAPEDALRGMGEAGILDRTELDVLLKAYRFERLVENRYQLMQEWTSREIARESPLLSRLAAGIGYKGDPTATRKAFLSDWDETAGSVRRLFLKYFYS